MGAVKCSISEKSVRPPVEELRITVTSIAVNVIVIFTLCKVALLAGMDPGLAVYLTLLL